MADYEGDKIWRKKEPRLHPLLFISMMVFLLSLVHYICNLFLILLLYFYLYGEYYFLYKVEKLLAFLTDL